MKLRTFSLKFLIIAIAVVAVSISVGRALFNNGLLGIWPVDFNSDQWKSADHFSLERTRMLQSLLCLDISHSLEKICNDGPFNGFVSGERYPINKSSVLAKLNKQQVLDLLGEPKSKSLNDSKSSPEFGWEEWDYRLSKLNDITDILGLRTFVNLGLVFDQQDVVQMVKVIYR